MTTEVEFTRRRFTVGEYDRMIEAGILTKYDRVELIHGEVVYKSPIGRRRAACRAALHALFVLRLDRRALVRSAGHISLPPDSAPEPDVVLLRWCDDFYRTVPTLADDVLLAIEVAETSLRYDRRVKVPLYAERGIREVWIVDVEGDCVEVYRGQTDGAYGSTQRIPRGTVLSPEAFPDVVLTVADILG